ncbi:hypothetical protein B0H11DRAFT_2101093 [Mycena galericulata]|nr:hypothetical protein B0H11DRAFT_2101093 [Mycena galericulata]
MDAQNFEETLRLDTKIALSVDTQLRNDENFPPHKILLLAIKEYVGQQYTSEQCEKLLAENHLPLFGLLYQASTTRSYKKLVEAAMALLSANPSHSAEPSALASVASNPPSQLITDQPEGQTATPADTTIPPEVIAILERVTESMQRISSPRWKWPSWKPSQKLDTAIHEWLSDLNIPELNGQPSLLLHELGTLQNDPHMKKRISKLFTQKYSTFLVNTSGSGKTRHIFEALCRHWGFYFPLSVGTYDPMGSTDMQNCIDTRLSSTPHFTEDLSRVAADKFEEALLKNREIADDCFTQVLLARILVFQHFLTTIVKSGRKITRGDKRRWLLLQICPRLLGGPFYDVFDEVARALNQRGLNMARCEETNTQLISDLRLFLSEHSKSTRRNHDGPEDFYLVVDEAQLAATTLRSAFRSERDRSHARSVLRQIIVVLARLLPKAGFGLVVAGTGVDKDLVDEALQSSIGKIKPRRFTSVTGAFDPQENSTDFHEQYIKRYLPPAFRTTADGERFVARVTTWCEGRFRLTATFLTQLLKSDFKRPHWVLKEWIHHNTRFTPTDATDLTERHGVKIQFLSDPLYKQIDFERIQQKSGMISLFTDALYESFLRDEITKTIHGKDDIFVQCGFARYRDRGCTKASIKEPLIILAAAGHIRTEFSRLGAETIQQHVRRNIGSRTGSKSNGFESYVAFILADAFGKPTPLTDIFKFFPGARLPEWLKQSARLVVVSRDPGSPTPSVYNWDWPAFSVPAGLFGRSCGPADTMSWLEHRFKTPFCFPDDNMGPDILCVLKLDDGSLMWVAVQVKFWGNTNNLQNGKPADLNQRLRKAIRSTVPSQFWKNRNGTTWNSRKNPRDYAKDTLKALNGLPGPKMTGSRSTHRLLRVVVVFPTSIGIEDIAVADATRSTASEGTHRDSGGHPLGTLNWEHFNEIDEERYVEVMDKDFERIKTNANGSDLEDTDMEAASASGRDEDMKSELSNTSGEDTEAGLSSSDEYTEDETSSSSGDNMEDVTSTTPVPTLKRLRTELPGSVGDINNESGTPKYKKPRPGSPGSTLNRKKRRPGPRKEPQAGE